VGDTPDRSNFWPGGLVYTILRIQIQYMIHVPPVPVPARFVLYWPLQYARPAAPVLRVMWPAAALRNNKSRSARLRLGVSRPPPSTSLPLGWRRRPVRSRPRPPHHPPPPAMGKNMRIKTTPKANRVPLLHNGVSAVTPPPLSFACGRSSVPFFWVLG
jgi:hypothetical protein